jgi:hypothetical protein
MAKLIVDGAKKERKKINELMPKIKLLGLYLEPKKKDYNLASKNTMY